MNCCFCNKEIDEKYSNNAEPLSSGRCCSECNLKKVVPYRLSISKPKFIMMVGIPGSGKSYYAN